MKQYTILICTLFYILRSPPKARVFDAPHVFVSRAQECSGVFWSKAGFALLRCAVSCRQHTDALVCLLLLWSLAVAASDHSNKYIDPLKRINRQRRSGDQGEHPNSCFTPLKLQNCPQKLFFKRSSPMACWVYDRREQRRNMGCERVGRRKRRRSRVEPRTS